MMSMTDLFSLLLTWTLKTSLILGLALGVGFALRKASAHLRCSVWTTALYAIALMPIVSWGLPQWHLGWTSFSVQDSQSQPMATQKEFVHAELPPLNTPVTTVQTTPPIAKTSRAPFLMARLDWRQWAALLWLAVALWLLLRLGNDIWSARKMTLRALPIQAKRWQELTSELKTAMGLTIPIQLAISNEISSPMTWGFHKPVVILPDRALAWSSERARVVMLHEMAHIQRGDFTTNFVARLIQAIWWFNPLCQMIVKRLIRDREHACDDVVILQGHRGSSYAQHLLSIAQNLAQGRPPLSAVSMAHLTQLEGRLMSILNTNQRRIAKVNYLGTTLKLMILLLLLPLAMAHPGSGKYSPEPKASPEPVAATRSTESPQPKSNDTHSKKLTKAQINAAYDAGLFDRYSDHEVRYIFSSNISLDGLQSFTDANLEQRFSLHDIGYLLSHEITPDMLADFSQAKLINRFSAHDLAYLIDNDMPVSYIQSLQEINLLNRFSAHDMVFLYQRETSIDYLSQLREANLIRRFSAHDSAFLQAKNVPIEFLTQFKKQNMISRFSAHDLAYLKESKVSLEFLETISNAQLLHRFSAHDLGYLSKSEVDIDYLIDMKEIGVIERFSAHDANHLYSEEVATDYLDAMNKAALIHRYSAHDISHLFSHDVTMNYLKDLEEAGYIHRFSAHDTSKLFGNQVTMAFIDTYKDEGLLRHISGYSLAYLFQSPVPFEFLHQLKDAKVLKYFSGFDLSYIYKKGITLQQIIDAVKAGRLDHRYGNEYIRTVFP